VSVKVSGPANKLRRLLQSWLELGFRPDYFEKTLEHFGWSSTQVNCDDTGWGTVVVARRTSES
jgi:hypothetical protein